MIRMGSVLIVDDDGDIRTVLVTRLVGAGYEVGEASSGRSAVERIAQGTYDVVILDLMMPDMSGFEVLEKIRDERDMPGVIILSAAGHRDHRLRGLYGGALDFLGKPFDLDELVARVAAAVRSRKNLRLVRRQAETDMLTGIGNRRAFDERLRAELDRAIRYRHRLALVLVDADGLKVVNDAHGHSAGDRLLATIAAALAANCRTSDAAFRIGGDEFALILPETPKAAVEAVKDRIDEMLTLEDLRIGSAVLPVSVSMGIAAYPDDGADPDDLFRAADADMYRHKAPAARAGRGEMESAGDRASCAVRKVIESSHCEERSDEAISAGNRDCFVGPDGPPRKVRIEPLRPPETPRPSTRQKLLLVEDDLDLADMVGIRLEGLGFDVESAPTRRDGLIALRRSRPDLLILDLCLPDGSGLDLLHEIRDDESLRSLPVILLTGLGTSDHIVDGFSRGANAYLPKPYDPAQLESAIRTLLAEAA